jgi:mutual gliding-motility protein MglA
MALFNHATKEVTAKLVYYGPGLCGKTTNLQWIHDQVPFKAKGKLLSLATEADRTLFFDFLPVELGTIRGMRTRVQLYTVPGQVFYESTRRMVLKGADAVVFVADSQAAMLDADAESLESLRRNLIANGLDPELPLVLQYNKRDLRTALPLDKLNGRLNPRGLPFFEAVAVKGTGVEETLKGITRLLFKSLAEFYGTSEGAADIAATEPSSSEEPIDLSAVIEEEDVTVSEESLGLSAEATRRAASTPPAAPPKPTAPRPVAAEAPAVRPAAPAVKAAAPSAEPVAPAARPAAPAPVAPAPKSAPPPAATTKPAAPPPAAAAKPAPTPPVAAAPKPPPPKPAASAPKPTPPAGTARPAATPAPSAEEFEAPTLRLKGVPPLSAPPPDPVRAPVPPAPVSVPEPAPMARIPEAAAVAVEPSPAPAPGAPEDPAPQSAVLRPGQWLYLIDGKQRGPLDLDDLLDLIFTSIPEKTKVYRLGMSHWEPANLVAEISEHIPPPLPLPSGGDEDFPDFNTVPEMLRTALIADEDAGFRKFLGMPLAAQGFKIWEARDGAEAWKIAVDHRPWLMLADIDMPDVDGFEFCRRVRANALLSHTPLVFISGSDRVKDRYRALQLGADDFLSKHTSVRELLIRIQVLLTRYSDLRGASAEADSGSGAEVPGALEGRLEVFGAPGVLQICNQGRLSGIFTARAQGDRPGDSDPGKIAVFGFREGEIISATAEGKNGPEAVYAFLAWTHGQFKFAPGDPGQGKPIAQSVEHLLLEGCRLLDESNRDGAGDGLAG